VIHQRVGQVLKKIKEKRFDNMELDISKLKEGQEIKNYKVMCELLGQEAKDGRSKEYQLKDWERYFSWHNDGHKFIIDEIYDKPIPKIDLRNNGNYSKYINEIADILVYWLSNNTSTNQYNFSLGKLIEITCMANPSFYIGNRFREATSAVLKLNQEEVEVFFTDMRIEFKTIIERALKVLETRCVILVKNTITVYDKLKKVHRLATADEEEFILDWEKETLKELGLRDRREMFIKKKLYKFNNKMRPHIAVIDCSYYYYSYNITIGQNALAIEKEIIDKQKERLNTKCVDRAKEKFDYSDIAIKLITEFIDMNTDWLELSSKIDLAQEEIKKEKELQRKGAKDFDELMIIAVAEKANIEAQYQYDVSGEAKRNIYNKLTNDEKFLREIGI
jgi:hypothetical protein